MSVERLKQIKKEIELVRREIGKEALSREDRRVPNNIYTALTNKIDAYCEDIRQEIINNHNNAEAVITIYNGNVVKINKDGIYWDATDIEKHEGERIYL